MSLNESIVEDAALSWFGELGYAIGHGPHLAPGEPAAERDSFGEVVLVGRLRAAISRLNLAIPEDAQEDTLRKLLSVGTPSLTQTNRAFQRMLPDGVPLEYELAQETSFKLLKKALRDYGHGRCSAQVFCESRQISRQFGGISRNYMA